MAIRSAIDRLVAQPGAVKLFGIEMDDDLPGLFVEHREVHLDRERGGLLKTRDVVADVQPANGQAAVGPGRRLP